MTATATPVATTTQPGAERVRTRSAARWIRRSAVLVLILLVWQSASWLGLINRAVLASPGEVVAYLWTLVLDGSLFANVGVSFLRVVAGLLIGGTVATALGLIAGLSRVGEDAIDPPLQAYRTLPFLGLAPLLIAWFGIGEGLKVSLVALGVIFPIYLNLYKGVRAVDHRYAELAKVQGLSRRELVLRVIIPGALPSYMIGLRYSLGIAWLCLVIAEPINAVNGVGFILQRGKDFLRTDMIIAALVIYAVLGILIEVLVTLLERKLMPWQKEFIR